MARRRKLSPERKAFINSLLEHYQPNDAQDVQNMLKDLLGDTLQGMLEAEMDEKLGYVSFFNPVEPGKPGGSCPTGLDGILILRFDHATGLDPAPFIIKCRRNDTTPPFPGFPESVTLLAVFNPGVDDRPIQAFHMETPDHGELFSVPGPVGGNDGNHIIRAYYALCFQRPAKLCDHIPGKPEPFCPVADRAQFR